MVGLDLAKTRLDQAVEDSIQRAVDHLLRLQSPDGFCWAELESNVTMASQHLLLEEFLGIGDAPRRRKLCTYLLDHQQADGSWGGIQPPWVYSLIVLHCLGYANDHPVMARGLRGLYEGFALETDRTFTIQPCVSPVWDTALAVTALREAGLAAVDAIDKRRLGRDLRPV